MIKEAYCSFEVAKLLKDKRFNEPCRDFYRKENEEWLHRNTYEYNCFNLQMPRWENCYSCPTHQMAMAWLREKYNAVIVIDVCRETGREGFYCWQLEDNRTGDWIDNIVGECPTYEQACEEALKYCLEKIIK